METYEELLTRAMAKVPKKTGTGERFEMPKIDAVAQGNNTIIKNFGDICAKLRRDPKHLMKFLTKELAAPGSTDGTRASFQGRLSYRMLVGKLELYAKEYVICKVCGRPDTKLVKEGRIDQMKCEACGARSPVREI
ncbi:MAG: translation initiation factor IF-2 subunit beta [Candidatus Aenigmatarchaeota archaeon]